MARTALPAPLGDGEPKLTCFVIGPIGDRLAPVDSPHRRAYEDALEIFEKVVLPACNSLEIEPLRVDHIAHAGEITEQIYRHLLVDDIVIADIGGGNANVMYELGIRHATGKPTIQIGEHGLLPFDVSLIKTIRFTRSQSGLVDARNDLRAAIEAGIRKGFDLLAPARIQSGLLASGVDAAPELSVAEQEDEEAPGFLDDLVAVETGMEELTRDAERIAELLTAIGGVAERVKDEMDDVNRAGDSMNARMGVVARFADAVKAPAASLEQVAIHFNQRMGALDAGMGGALTLIEKMPPRERGDDVREFLTQLVGLSESTREGMEGMASFGVSVDGFGAASRILRGPARSILSAVHHMTSSVSCMDEWERRARRLLDE